ncbi:MAG TPA: NAD-binding protein, partial [Longimicrobiales bacterium]|nr:NAD-binding protein [Longimicrobiales bacterium]
MHILLVGSGRQAYFLARRFLDLGHRVTLVAEEADDAHRLVRALEGVTVVAGDGARPDVLDDAGALHADAVVAATSEDHRNLVACQMARRVFFVGRTIAVVKDPDNAEPTEDLCVVGVLDHCDGPAHEEHPTRHLARHQVA